MNVASKILGVIALSLATVIPSHATDCGTIIDPTGVLDASVLTPIAQRLNKNGADAHFVAVKEYGAGVPNATVYEKNLEKACGWGSDNSRQANLVVFLVSLKGFATIDTGGEYHAAVGTQLGDIRKDRMNPFFSNKKYTEGLAAGANYIADSIIVDKVATGSKKSVVVNEATDYSGFWAVLKWLLFVTVLGLLGYFVYNFYQKKKEAREAALAAQRTARTEKNTAVTKVNNIAIDPRVDSIVLAAIQRDLDDLDKSAKYDVEASGLEEEDYRTIATQYSRISARADAAIAPTVVKNADGGVKSAYRPHSRTLYHAGDDVYGRPPSSVPGPTPPASGTTHVTNNYIDNSSRGGFYDPYPIAPVVILENDTPTRYDDDRGWGSGGDRGWGSGGHQAPDNGDSNGGSFDTSGDSGDSNGGTFASSDAGDSNGGTFS